MRSKTGASLRHSQNFRTRLLGYLERRIVPVKRAASCVSDVRLSKFSDVKESQHVG
jgi:hypothetical protein